MLRRAITAVLIFMALAGPGLCCCTWMQSVPLIATPAPRGAMHSHRSGHRCCHHQSHHSKSKSTPQCPCRHHTAIQVALLASDTEQMAQVGGDSFVRANWDLFLLLPKPASQEESEARIVEHALDSPFASAKGLLRAFCVLRC